MNYSIAQILITAFGTAILVIFAYHILEKSGAIENRDVRALFFSMLVAFFVSLANILGEEFGPLVATVYIAALIFWMSLVVSLSSKWI